MSDMTSFRSRKIANGEKGGIGKSWERVFIILRLPMSKKTMSYAANCRY